MAYKYTNETELMVNNACVDILNYDEFDFKRIVSIPVFIPTPDTNKNEKGRINFIQKEILIDHGDSVHLNQKYYGVSNYIIVKLLP